jgi:hypothetical protein
MTGLPNWDVMRGCAPRLWFACFLANTSYRPDAEYDDVYSIFQGWVVISTSPLGHLSLSFSERSPFRGIAVLPSHVEHRILEFDYLALRLPLRLSQHVFVGGFVGWGI